MTSLKKLPLLPRLGGFTQLVLIRCIDSFPLAQSGASFYVSKSGSNSNSGSFTAPWLTIQHAASSVTAGATVYVEAGVYNESVNFPASGPRRTTSRLTSRPLSESPAENSTYPAMHNIVYDHIYLLLPYN